MAAKTYTVYIQTQAERQLTLVAKNHATSVLALQTTVNNLRTAVNELKTDFNALLTKLDANHGAATDHVATLSISSTVPAASALDVDTVKRGN